MNTFLVIINIVILLALIVGLFMMQKKHVSFSKRVFAGLGLGILFGIILNLIYGTTSEVTTTTIAWFNVVGSGYVKLLQMVVMPLIFISIVGAFTKVKISESWENQLLWNRDSFSHNGDFSGHCDCCYGWFWFRGNGIAGRGSGKCPQ